MSFHFAITAAVGIDLGTTFSVVGVNVNGKVVDLIPSISGRNHQFSISIVYNLRAIRLILFLTLCTGPHN